MKKIIKCDTYSEMNDIIRTSRNVTNLKKKNGEMILINVDNKSMLAYPNYDKLEFTIIKEGIENITEYLTQYKLFFDSSGQMLNFINKRITYPKFVMDCHEIMIKYDLSDLIIVRINNDLCLGQTDYETNQFNIFAVNDDEIIKYLKNEL